MEKGGLRLERREREGGVSRKDIPLEAIREELFSSRRIIGIGIGIRRNGFDVQRGWVFFSSLLIYSAQL